MISTLVKRPALRYHGGKWRLAKWIISHFPQHRIYTEVFGGGGSVLLQKQRCYAEVYNDKWDIVVNVFQVLRDNPEQLRRALELTPFSRTEFNTCGDVDLAAITDPVEKARRTILRSFAGFGSASTNAKYSTGFRANSNRSGTTPAHDWMHFPDHIQSFASRLRGVIIENKDYREVLKQHDTPQTLHFMDPPYVHVTRNMARGNAAYAHEFTDDDHRDMVQHANELRGMVVICGYESNLYNEILTGWHKVRKAHHADGARDRIECLWMNFKPTGLFK